ncbi:hypothetical protein HS1genome_0835 [Sulfodiicoccus acidiphilus]|uniref:Uncharacterized protein n=1 Tax=Sulfodiicoccus acidiphilus TaxID=1670455 RepID=A0A348B2P4_9CREN|nr:FAD/NAD(P)-binding protein [Sulfodiicoccus acidiphilus]BBD72446.1 hypothetical protein HS1genome_0835 [Sulfodiicoccus acidiphilus]GGT97084.1 hypothetical protein GCM10007116_13230 [Sulfodiicoccus acidiphilus]
MDLVIGGGIAGLVVGKRTRGLVIEEQPRLGGVFAIEELMDLKVPTIAPVVWNPSCADVLQEKLRVQEVEAVWTGKGKLELDNVEWAPIPSKRFFLIQNMDMFIEGSFREVRTMRARIIRLTTSRVVLSNGASLPLDSVYNAGSRRRVGEMLGIKEELSSLAVGVTLMISEKLRTDWNVAIMRGTSFQYALRIEAPKWDLVFAYSIYEPEKIPPDLLQRVVSEAKRKSLVGTVVAVRQRVLREGVLSGSPGGQFPSNFHHCGRLGEWKNLDLCSTIESAESC